MFSNYLVTYLFWSLKFKASLDRFYLLAFHQNILAADK